MALSNKRKEEIKAVIISVLLKDMLEDAHKDNLFAVSISQVKLGLEHAKLRVNHIDLGILVYELYTDGIIWFYYDMADNKDCVFVRIHDETTSYDTWEMYSRLIFIPVTELVPHEHR